jgi:hypothetical protein
VVAERAFGRARGRDLADDRELGVGDERQRAGRVPRDRELPPSSRLARSTSGTFSGNGAIAASIRAGGPPTNTFTGSARPRRLAAARWNPPPLPI